MISCVYSCVRLVILFLLLSVPCFAQRNDSIDKPTFSVLPIIYYTPETKWVFGAGAVSTFKLGDNPEITYESQASLGAAYSLLKQTLLFGNWRIFSSANTNLYAGEVGWYDYVFFFYGIGAQVQASDQEVFSAKLPRIRFDYARQIKTNLFLGGKYAYDNFELDSFDPDGQLISGDFRGSEGGKISGIGPWLVYDSRDNQLYPTSGYYGELSFQRFDRAIGGNFDYNRLFVDLRKIFPTGKNQILVGNLYSEFSSSGVPFFGLPMMGGNKRMRGLLEGKFRDRNMLLLQGEYRWKFLPRWGAVAFTGAGNVFSKENDFKLNETKITYGLGGRFQLSKKKKLNLRLDLAHSPGEDLKFYFTFGEAF